jgi:hypothetical protein
VVNIVKNQVLLHQPPHADKGTQPPEKGEMAIPHLFIINLS